MRRETKGKVLTIISGMALAMILFAGTPSISMAYPQTNGIVSATAAKVRKEPNTESDMVTSLLKGSSVTVVDEVTDSAGTLWYKVSVDNSTGYIRSDLLLKANTPVSGTNTSTDNTSQSNQSDSQTQPAQTQVKAIAETKAYVNYESVRVREGASTEHEIAGSAVKNTPVTITGEAKAADGKLWYQIKYNNSAGREIVGFVRSDLLTLGDPPAPVATEITQQEEEEQTEETEASEGEENTTAQEGETSEETTEEAPVETPVEEPDVQEIVKPDYEMVFTENKEGVEEWYLYDNINGTRQTLAGLMAAAEAGTRLSQANSEQASTQKVVIIVLAVLVAVLAVVVTFLLFKIKDMYDDGYEGYEEDEDEDEDEEEEDDEEEEPVIRRRRPVNAVKQTGGADKTRTVEPARTVREKGTQAVRKVEYRPEEEAFEAGRSVADKPQPKRKAKNFLIDDDEFEFEFLNMDDKNKE